MEERGIQELVETYLGADERALAISRIVHGLANEHYRVELSGGRVYFIKLYRTTRAELVSAEVNLVMALRGRGLATPAVLATRDGALYTRHGGRLVALFEFIEGSHPKQTPATLEQAGALLAQLHTCGLEMKLPAYVWSPAELFGMARAAATPDRQARDFFRRAADLCSTIPFGALPRSVTHCDLFLDNLILGQDGVLHLIDFEEAAFDHCLLDIGRAFIGCCISGERVNLDLCRALLRGYSRGRVLEPVEAESLHAYTIHAGLLSTYWRHDQFNVQRPDGKRSRIYRELMVPTLGLITEGKDRFDRTLGWVTQQGM